ncbi:MAG: hypothetical protein ACK4NS_06375 [Saprospiraceae bacterium]
MRLRFLVLFCAMFASLLLSNPLSAQDGGRFPTEPNDFVNRFGDFLTANKRPDLEEAYAVFKKGYKSGLYRPDEMRRIATASNAMAEQKLTPYPHFKDYVNALNAAKALSDTAVFSQWHTQLERVLAEATKGKIKPVAAYLKFSAAYMEQGAMRVGEGGSASWALRGGSRAFGYEDGQPTLTCAGSTLIGFRRQDTLRVEGVSGVFYPFDNVFKGQGGKVSWADAGLQEVYADLSRYQIDINKAIFRSDTAYLTYPLYFGGERIAGALEHNVIIENKAAALYPKFESFNKQIKISKIGEGIEYQGGFKLSGASLYGYGEPGIPARLTVYNNKRKRVFLGLGQQFIIKREQSIVGEGIDAKLFIDADSLFHPAVGVRIDIPKQVINLNRGNKGNERNPFFSSFYNMNLNTENIIWHINRDSLEIGGGFATAKGVAQRVQFESSNHYEQYKYDLIQGTASHNPISTLYRLWLETDSDKEDNGRLVSDNDFARRINPNFDYSNVQTILAQMVAEGYINYYFDRHQIELRDKLIHYALASQGKKDYDAINIISESTGANAKLDLKTKETEIYEVSKLELSKRQRVALLPDDKTLTLLKNRDMRMAGRLYAGFALFSGKDMFFEYEPFQVQFDKLFFLDFFIPTGEKDAKNQPVALPMNSRIEKLTGILLVDAPGNKSGKEDMSIFPSLQSKDYSYVYYDYKQTQNGVYTRDSFYFRLDRFSFDGLDSYTKDRLKFKGRMFPATIFPPFDETIVVRDHDRSFGFVHRTPAAGYPMYAAKGKYTGEADLSNKGFLGKGKLEYLTATIDSEDLIFRPKQTTGTARKFFMTEDRTSAVQVPQAKGEEVSVNWLPFRDSMYVESKAKDFELFKAPGYTHKGVLILTPSGLKGSGAFEWAEGRLVSKLIAYGPFQAKADTADLQIKALKGDDVLFDTRNVRADIDFDKQKGDFKANTENATTLLPLNKYRTSMNEFFWDMKGRTITFRADEKKPALFVSTDPAQDTLAFNGKTALYDMNKSLLKIGGVEVIKSADAYIYPDDGNVNIESGGKMTALKNCRIVADTVNRYHSITRADVEIGGKKFYKASGYYQYNITGYEQEIFFDNIVGERRGPGSPATKNVLTTASGLIKEDANFHMDVKTRYQGKIILKANQQNLRFEGFAQIDADKLKDMNWFSVYTEVDKNDPTVRIKKAKTMDDIPLKTGFFLSKEFSDAYPRILQATRESRDRLLFDAQDVFNYDEKNDRFIFGDSAKIVANARRGARMIFDNRVGTLIGEGQINIGSELRYMKVKAAGRIKTDYNKPDSLSFKVSAELMTGMEIIFPKAVMDILINDIRAAGFDAIPAAYNTNQPFYQITLPEFISDDKDLGEALNNLSLNTLALPKKDDKFTFVIGRHNVLWNEEYQSFISMDDRIPLVSINGEPMNRVFNMFVEYKMPANNDDRFYLYIKPSPDLWYFFGYQSGTLNVASSSPRFTDALAALKTKETLLKMPDGDTYEIVLVNPSTADAFVNRVRSGRN